MKAEEPKVEEVKTEEKPEAPAAAPAAPPVATAPAAAPGTLALNNPQAMLLAQQMQILLQQQAAQRQAVSVLAHLFF